MCSSSISIHGALCLVVPPYVYGTLSLEDVVLTFDDLMFGVVSLEGFSLGMLDSVGTNAAILGGEEGVGGSDGVLDAVKGGCQGTAHSNDIKVYVSLMHQGIYLLPMFADICYFLLDLVMLDSE